ncbi:MAG TPA: cyanophycinase [Ignavibacteriales bacterium]|nr:cyanophycinase [Ignavibacteriales bacterium]
MTRIIFSHKPSEMHLKNPSGAGHLFIIGGGPRPPYMMERFIELAGGIDSKIVIVPAASTTPLETGMRHKTELENAGCMYLSVINCLKREDADTSENLAMLSGAGAVFFSGGDQNKLVASLKGTRLLEKIKNVYLSGGVIGGTSAGAAIMSKVMIGGDGLNNSDTSPYLFNPIVREHVKLSEGFGFLENAIIDQHFNTRSRKNRLINAVLEHPQLSGVGIDESTAIIVNPEGSFEVLGENNVLVFSLLPDDEQSQADSSSNIDIKILKSGDRYIFPAVTT